MLSHFDITVKRLQRKKGFKTISFQSNSFANSITHQDGMQSCIHIQECNKMESEMSISYQGDFALLAS